MSTIRPVGGGGVPNPLRINGQDVQPAVTPVEGRRLPTGTQTEKPVEAPSDPYQLQEHAYDKAHQNALRGQNAAATIAGKKKQQARGVAGMRTDTHRRVERRERDDPHEKQERAYETAAEFEEHVKEGDMSFRRRPAQVFAGDNVYHADEVQGGAVVSGESALEFTFEDTVPDRALPEATQTSLREALGLGPKR